MTVLRASLLAVLALGFAGCGGSSYKVAPVSGQVLLDGKPLANAAVMFTPISPGKSDPGPSSGAVTDSDGRFTLTVNDGSQREGAIVGKHKIVITTRDAPGGDTQRTRHRQLPAMYNRNSTLEFDVPSGGTTSADFKLHSNTGT